MLLRNTTLNWNFTGSGMTSRGHGVFDVMIQKSGFEKKELSNANIQLCSHEFCRPFSFDGAPGGRRCEWCGEPAEKHVTAIGGTHHNQGGFFCCSCGETFCAIIANALEASLC
jgi:hypothetical protein